MALSLVHSCKFPPKLDPNDDGGALPPAVEVSYGSHPRQRIDVFPVPSAPLVVFVHGGGWTSGKKTMFAPLLERLRRTGIAGASVGYRLADGPENAFPVPVRDVRCALGWLYANGQSVGVDGTRMVLVGASAGGHLALLAVLGKDEPAFRDAGCSDFSVRGVASYYAPVRLDVAKTLYPARMQLAVAELLRRDPDDSGFDVLAARATVTRYVKAGAPPVFVTHGTADMVVPWNDADALVSSLRAAGINTLVVPGEGRSHGYAILDDRSPAVGCSLLSFIETVTRETPRRSGDAGVGCATVIRP